MESSHATSDLIATLLSRRGIDTPDAVSAFLRPDYARDTHDASLLQDIDIATARIVRAIDANERIAIYADFDCDGIPGAAVLHDFFTRIGYDNVEVYIPHRDREGYGFHTDAIDDLASRSVMLIITVDVGTTAVDPVSYASRKGIDVIVTDHHEITGELPQAIALINPKRPARDAEPAYPFPHLCGAGMAFKLVQATLTYGRAQNHERFLSIPMGWEKWLLDLVAIATIADMVSLTGENRALVHWGLQVLRKSPRPGIIALCSKLRLRRADLTEDDIGFSIAPRINAASRMDEPDLAFTLLTTRDEREADVIVAKLDGLNTKRKGIVASIVREARKRMHERFTEEDRIVVLGDPEWKPALLGLAANSLMSDRGGVVVLWGRDANGRLKGSARSDGSISIAELFAAAGDHLEEYGGHAASGGFSVAPERVHALLEHLVDAAATVSLSTVEEDASHDMILSLREVGMPLLRDLSQLAPFGMGNPKPIFKIAGAQIRAVRAFGKEKNHIEIELSPSVDSPTVRAFDFFRTHEGFTLPPAVGESVAVLTTIERDTYRGGVVLRLIDIIPDESTR